MWSCSRQARSPTRTPFSTSSTPEAGFAVVYGRTVKRITTVSQEVGSAIIVDNNPECYRFDRCNAIPISSWYGDAKDKELRNLLPFLDLMRSVDDVRCVLALNS